jgi:hypothetical protein
MIDPCQILILQFETATVPLDQFHHREHLMVALWYALHLPPEEALRKMRAGLQRLLAANRKPPEAYCEQITMMWIERAVAFAAANDRGRDFADLCSQWLGEVANLPKKL